MKISRNNKNVIDVIRDRLKIARSRQKSYANIKRRTWELQVRYMIYLRVSLTKGVKRFRVKGKFNPRYIGPFRFLRQKEPVTYELEKPLNYRELQLQ
jgi:hypothetical protein